MRLFVIACSAVLSFAACSRPDAVVADRLQECGLASEGEVGSGLLQAFYQPNACYRTCLAGASCADLSAALCGTSVALLQRCDQRCAHRCADGSLIAVEQVCDGFMQCEGGSDERGCATFACREGPVPARLRCDGYTNCASGEDERGCGAAFTCTGEWGTLGDWSRCNGYAECTDESDERGCPEYRCTDGTAQIHRDDVAPRCDGYPICSDGSDEIGCAVLAPMCATP